MAWNRGVVATVLGTFGTTSSGPDSVDGFWTTLEGSVREVAGRYQIF